MSEIKLFDEQGNEVQVIDLLETLKTWVAFNSHFECILDMAKQHKLSDEKRSEYIEAAATNFSFLIGALAQYGQNLAGRQTPNLSIQVALSALLEYLFSAIILEKYQFGVEFTPQQIQEEFMQTCYNHAQHVVNKLSEKINDGTFQQRVASADMLKTNAPSTMTRQ